MSRSYNPDDEVVDVEIVGCARTIKAVHALVLDDFEFRYDDDTYKSAAMSKLEELLTSGCDDITVPVETRLGGFVVNDYYIEKHTPK